MTKSKSRTNGRLETLGVQQPIQDKRVASGQAGPARQSARMRGNDSYSPQADAALDHEEVIVKRREPDSPIRVLLMCNYDPYNAATVCDHINSFFKFSSHQTAVFSNIGNLPDGFSFDPFDVIVVHYSLFIAIDAYVPPKVRKLLANFRGVKALFIQDEYRFINRTIDAFNRCGIDLVFTCVPESEIPKVYPPERLPNTRFINVLTGYVPDGLKLFKPKPLADRPIDVGYRGRVYPAWHGEAGREKHEIGRRFLADAKPYKLNCDIQWSEDSRIYGLQWVDFLRNCKATLAVESGASVFDFDGTIAAGSETFVELLGLSERQSSKVKKSLRSHQPYNRPADDRQLYEEIRELFFKEKENLIDLAQLSPRVFEAATLRTLLVMYEGNYSGIFKPWQHYVPLKKDHSNMPEIVDILGNTVECSKIIARCSAEICENDEYTFEKFINNFDNIIKDTVKPRHRSEIADFSIEEFYRNRIFYFIPYPHSLETSAEKRLPRNPFKLMAALIRPKPNSVTVKAALKNFIRRRF